MSAAVCDCGGFAHPVASVHMRSCEKLRTKVNLSLWMRGTEIRDLRRGGVQLDCVIHPDASLLLDGSYNLEQYWYGRCGFELLLRASGLWWNGALSHVRVATPHGFMQLAAKTLGSFREADGLPERLDYLAATYTVDAGADTVEKHQRRAAEVLQEALQDYPDSWHTMRLLSELSTWCEHQRFFRDCKTLRQEATWTP